MYILRRELLSGLMAASAIPFVDWWAEKAQAGGTAQPFVRHSAFSKEGRAALVAYAKAVDLMGQRSKADRTDPLGWFYQYKMHWFPDNGAEILGQGGFSALSAAQAAELTQVFGAGPSNKRKQAESVWGRCPHSLNGIFTANFFPWHRFYLFFFERIVRRLSGNASFALPYWGYMDGASSQTLPPEFIATRSSPLWHERSAKPNAGKSLAKEYFVGGFWNDAAFNPFSMDVEGTPHGDVHDGVGAAVEGDEFDMSSLFTSPKDPIFWLHHCEIDRIWEAGLKNGVSAPTGPWGSRVHHFFDEDGVFVEVKNSDALDTRLIAGRLGYVYDKLPQPPSPLVVASARSVASEASVLAVARDLKLKRGLHVNDIPPAPGQTRSALASRSAGRERRIMMEISGVALDKKVAANVGLYLNAPASAGTFALLPGISADDHSMHGESDGPIVRRFDVTNLVADLQSRGLWTGEIKLSTKEIDGSLGDATLAVGRVELKEQVTH
jgi:tyrosinase